MATISYTPSAPGCDVRLTTPDGDELVVKLSGVKDSKPEIEANSPLADNRALVTLATEYAANELAYRRLRSREKRQSHRAAADRQAREAVAMAQMIVRL